MHHVVGVFSVKVRSAQLTLITQSQILGIVDLLEKMSHSAVIVCDLLFLTIQPPSDFLRAFEVPHFLEGLAVLNVGKFLSLRVLAEVDDELGYSVSSSLLLGKLLLQVYLHVVFNLLLLLCHFN